MLGHADTVALNDKMMREGRSLNVGLIYASQLPSDVLSTGMETYISRVFAMALEDDAEATAAVLGGLAVTGKAPKMPAAVVPAPIPRKSRSTSTS